MTNNGIILFVKYPAPGRVKTRLAERIGVRLAAGMYRAFVDDMAQSLAIMKTASCVYFHPDREPASFKSWLGDNFSYHRQKGSNLGVRIKNALSEQFNCGREKLLLIGSDIPSITPYILKKGFESLDACGCVLGPTKDGGYYLIGFRRDAFCPDVFENISWSRDDVLLKTENKLNKIKCSYRKLSCLTDIDRFDDLREYYLWSANSGGIKNRTIEFIENNLKRFIENKEGRLYGKVRL